MCPEDSEINVYIAYHMEKYEKKYFYSAPVPNTKVSSQEHAFLPSKEPSHFRDGTPGSAFLSMQTRLAMSQPPKESFSSSLVLEGFTLPLFSSRIA